MKKKHLVTAALFCLSSISGASAAGNGSSGGGDVLVLDDRVVLADFAVQKVGKRIEKFDSALYAELDRIRKLLDLYGTDVDFVSKEIENPLIDYSFVDQIPAIKECEVRLPVTLPSDGSRLEQIACTVGGTTWIREDLFKRLSLRARALLLVHERLRGYSVPVSHEQIVDIVVGLDAALSAYNDQERGDLRRLTLKEKNAIEEMRRRIALLFPRSGWSFEVHRVLENGGGLVRFRPRDPIPDSTFIGVNSKIDHYGFFRREIGEDVVILNSRLEEAKLGKGTVVKNSVLKRLETGSYASIDGVSSPSDNPSSGKVGANTKVLNSYLKSGFILGDDVTLENVRSENDITVGNGSVLRNFDIYTNFWEAATIGSNVTMTDTRIVIQGDIRFSVGDSARVNSLRFNVEGQMGFFGPRFLKFTIVPRASLDGADQVLCDGKVNDNKWAELLFKNEYAVSRLQDLQNICKK